MGQCFDTTGSPFGPCPWPLCKCASSQGPSHQDTIIPMAALATLLCTFHRLQNPTAHGSSNGYARRERTSTQRQRKLQFWKQSGWGHHHGLRLAIRQLHYINSRRLVTWMKGGEMQFSFYFYSKTYVYASKAGRFSGVWVAHFISIFSVAQMSKVRTATDILI
jgi:hypothetical protein